MKAGEMSAAEIAAWQARMPRAFTAAPRVRAVRIAVAVGFVGWLGAVLWWFGITPQRLWHGLDGQIGRTSCRGRV